MITVQGRHSTGDDDVITSLVATYNMWYGCSLGESSLKIIEAIYSVGCQITTFFRVSYYWIHFKINIYRKQRMD